MLASRAAATPQPRAKFKIVSASGREAMSFQEDGTTSSGTRCVGSTESIAGHATVSRTVTYSETAGCDEEPTNCPAQQQLSGSEDGAYQATVSGTYTDHLAITLKRLPLRR